MSLIELTVDEFIRAQLRDAFPSHGLVSEESAGTNVDSEHCWILEPIDGTKHHMMGRAREVDPGSSRHWNLLPGPGCAKIARHYPSAVN